MGVISDMTDGADTADDGDGSEDVDNRPSHETRTDPFAREYDTSKIKLDDETTDRILGILVVASNLFR